MAFSSAPGYGNLPNGNFSPVIFSKKAQKAFRKTSVVEDITNSEYFGEIANYGDSVRIIKEPEITVSAYARGTQLSTQTLDDDEFSLIIDKANYFQFAVDDIEAKHAHVSFEELASNRAAYKLKDAYDEEVLGYLSGFAKSGTTWAANTTASGTAASASAGSDELLAANKLDFGEFGGTDGNSIAVDPAGGASVVTPLQVLNRMARLLDQQNVETENRWFVADPVFYEMLQDENSKLISNDYAEGEIIRNGRVTSGLVRGFRLYKSNNLAYIGTGPGAIASSGSTTNYGVVVAGHDSAVATASQISKTESFRSPDSFADVVRGMQLYGRKILRPEALVRAIYNVA